MQKNSENKYIFTQDDSSKEMKDTMLDRIHKTILYEKSKKWMYFPNAWQK